MYTSGNLSGWLSVAGKLLSALSLTTALPAHRTLATCTGRGLKACLRPSRIPPSLPALSYVANLRFMARVQLLNDTLTQLKFD